MKKYKVIKPSYQIMDKLNGKSILLKLERCARTCYRSYDKAHEGSAEQLVKFLIKHGHTSVLEHVSFTVVFTVDRGVSHELVRHRLASYSQQSTRYVKFDEVLFAQPSTIEKGTDAYKLFLKSCKQSADNYGAALAMGLKPEQARVTLTNGLATEIVVSANIREWRHIFTQRCSPAAHPDIRFVMCKLLEELKRKIPICFDDIEVGAEWNEAHTK